MQRRDLQRLLAAGMLGLVTLLAAVPVAAASDQASDSTVELDAAVLRWGMTNEANNAAHAPGTWNFFSAGKIPNPGKGGTMLPQANWSQQAGNVSIEKWNGTIYRPATYAGLSTDKAGVKITSAGSGRYSDHQLVFGKGTGTADPEAGSAHVAWTGSASVIFYSGFTFFYLSDPVLDVADGNGRLTATLSGFGSSIDDTTAWLPIPPVTVTVADLPGVTFTEAGFTATPAYDGVQVTTSAGPVSNAFPQSFIDFTEDLGTAAFWYESGGSTDKAKKALPLTVSFDEANAVTPPAPQEQTPTAEVENDAPDPPKIVEKTVTRTITAAAPVVAAPVPSAVVPLTATQTAPLLTQSPVLELVATDTSSTTASDATGWWLGGGLLALAALIAIGALKFPSTVSRRALA